MSDPSKRGSNGGNARAAKLTKEQRSAIAKQAAAKRWAKKDTVALPEDHIAISYASSKTEEPPATPSTSFVMDESPNPIPSSFIYANEAKAQSIPTPTAQESAKATQRRRKPIVKEFGRAYSKAEKLLDEALRKRSEAIKVILACNEDIPSYVDVIRSLGGTINPEALKKVDIPQLSRLSPNPQYQYQPAYELVSPQTVAGSAQNLPNPVDPALFRANDNPLPGLVPAAAQAPLISKTAMGGAADLDYVPREEEGPPLPKMGGEWA